jgi:SAM-dependent methyltransferase
VAHVSSKPAGPKGWSRRRDYAAWFDRPLGHAYRRSLEAVLAPWIAERKARLALDAGCGPILTFLDAFDPSTEIVAADCSLEMARSASERLEARGRRGAALCASVERLPFPDGIFEFVLSINCLEFVADPSRALAELHRVAAPGARAVIGVLNRRGCWEWSRRLRRPWSSRTYYTGRFFTRGELVERLRVAGWQVEHVRSTVRFPPVSLPRVSWYRRLERLVPDARAGVLVACAVRGAREERTPLATEAP